MIVFMHMACGKTTLSRQYPDYLLDVDDIINTLAVKSELSALRMVALDSGDWSEVNRRQSCLIASYFANNITDQRILLAHGPGYLPEIPVWVLGSVKASPALLSEGAKSRGFDERGRRLMELNASSSPPDAVVCSSWVEVSKCVKGYIETARQEWAGRLARRQTPECWESSAKRLAWRGLSALEAGEFDPRIVFRDGFQFARDVEVELSMCVEAQRCGLPMCSNCWSGPDVNAKAAGMLRRLMSYTHCSTDHACGFAACERCSSGQFTVCVLDLLFPDQERPDRKSVV